MTRFDAPAYVQTWADTGRYPTIHTAMAEVVTTHTAPGEHVLDLGCSTGLLGRQMADRGRVVTALDADERAMMIGREAGVFDGIRYFNTRLTPKTMPDVLNWIADHHPTTVMARRIFPELHDALGTAGLDEFVERLASLGVQQIVLEGRMPSNRMTHPLCTADREVEALSGHWSPLDSGHGYAHVRVLHPA